MAKLTDLTIAVADLTTAVSAAKDRDAALAANPIPDAVVDEIKSITAAVGELAATVPATPTPLVPAGATAEGIAS